MSGVLLLFLTALRLQALPNQNVTNDDIYYELPRFWTNCGFCPAGSTEYKDMSRTFFSEPVQMNIRHIAALPLNSITHIRIHWLLELIQFVQFTEHGVPIYDFTDLDTFLFYLDDMQLYPVIEFMCNPGNLFNKNPARNEFYWEDLSFQLVKRYLNIFGAGKVTQWKFESWNEPDLISYNKLNFTVKDYLSYLKALQKGLMAAGHRNENCLHFRLRGPAGLFKDKRRHPLCWKTLEECNSNITNCPFEVLTYHKKGNGLARDVVQLSTSLLEEIYTIYPTLRKLPISNDEADPISGWSTPHPFLEDVRYAVTLVLIVLYHWSAKLQKNEFKNLETISHDNAFLSYHPYEFSQRTLLAHFQMNNTRPVHSQFVQKPVYAGLGMLSRLGNVATDLETLITQAPDSEVILFKTTENKRPLFLSWIFVQARNGTCNNNFAFKRKLPLDLCENETFSFVLELLVQDHTDPVRIWRSFGSPPYPNSTVRAEMRRAQTPLMKAAGVLMAPAIEIYLKYEGAWIAHFRVCSNLMPALLQPQKLVVTEVTGGEVLITWREVTNNTQCLKTYEVWFKASDMKRYIYVSLGVHLPFPSYQFAPADGKVCGFYKVRGKNISNNTSPFSEAVEYVEF